MRVTVHTYLSDKNTAVRSDTHTQLVIITNNPYLSTNMHLCVFIYKSCEMLRKTEKKLNETMRDTYNKIQNVRKDVHEYHHDVWYERQHVKQD